MRLGRIGFWYRLAVVLLKPPLLLLTKRRWIGLDHVPSTGGVIVAANHISFVDPLCVADAIMFSTKRMPRFLAKSTLFEGNGLLGRTMRGAKQIPVHRNTSDASAALQSAVEALQAGELVLIYPEGTVSRDPDKWPMATRTGVARLALLSGAPVVPVAQWGAQELHDSYRSNRFRLFGRPLVTVQAGPEVDLDPWRGKELTGPVLREATDAVMAEIRTMLEGIRAQKAPATVFEPSRERSA